MRSFFQISQAMRAAQTKTSQRMQYKSYNFFSQGRQGFINFYNILNVSQSATSEEIKSAYHKLAKQYHPDITKEEKNSDKFKAISEAYSVLSNEQRRKDYDQKLKSSHQQQQQKFYQQGGQSHQGQQQDYTNAYQESQKMNRQNTEDSNKYKTQRDYRGFQRRDFDDGNMVEEGFFNTLRNAPELIAITWVYLAHQERRIYTKYSKQQQADEDDFWAEDDEDENEREIREYKKEIMRRQNKKKIYLLDSDCRSKSLQELSDLYSTGLYELPIHYKKRVVEFQMLQKQVEEDEKNQILNNVLPPQTGDSFNFKKRFSSNKQASTIQTDNDQIPEKRDLIQEDKAQTTDNKIQNQQVQYQQPSDTQAVQDHKFQVNELQSKETVLGEQQKSFQRAN